MGGSNIMKITKKELRKIIKETLSIQTIPPKYLAIINSIPDLSLAVIEDPLIDASLDLHSGDEMIASVQFKELTGADINHPCIPNTMSISAIHTSLDYQELGIGELMFDLAFYYAELKGYGITTDFDGGNTPIINYIIKKALQNDPSYYKQVTKMGNDMMDFFNATSDPDDDCYSELFDNEGVYELVNDEGYTEEEAYDAVGFGSPGSEKFPIGTTSSWRKRGIESIKPLWDMLTQKPRPDILYRSNVRGNQFRDSYSNTPTPEEIRRREEEKRRNN
jgi:hypothetical protein